MYTNNRRVIIFFVFFTILSFGLFPLLFYPLLILLFSIIVATHKHPSTFYKRKNVELRKIVFIYLFYLLLNSFSLDLNFLYRNLYVTAEFLISYILLDIMLEYKYNKKSILFFYRLSLIYIIIAIMIAILTRDFQRYSFFFQNKNTFGATVLYLYAPLILVINKSKKYKYYILNFLFLSLLFISGARSSFLVFFLYLILSPFLSSSIFKYFKCYFIGSIFLSLIFINSYINITDFANYEILNNISEETSGSQIASGRNVIWGKVMEYLHTNNLYLFGLGSGARLSDMFSGVGLSCHNLYIQILLQNGIIGLILFLTFIYLFFKVIKKKINVRDSIKINLFFFIYLLFIQQNFEVFFFQNNMLFMFIFALLLPLFNYKKTEIIVALSKKQSQNENDIPHSDKN